MSKLSVIASLTSRRPIDSSDFPDLLENLSSLVTAKSLKKQFKLLKKYEQIQYHLTLATLVAKALDTYIPEKVSNCDTVTVVLDQLTRFDYLDSLRWLALVPMMLAKPNLNLRVIGVTGTDVQDSESNARRVIDNYINAELAPNQFTSSVYKAHLTEIIESASPDIVINNIADHQYIGEQVDSDCLSFITSRAVPYVLVDFTESSLLLYRHMLEKAGYAISPITINPLSFAFSKNNRTKYRHGENMIALVGHSGAEKPESLAEQYDLLFRILSVRLEHGDKLLSKHIGVGSPDSIQLFKDTYFNRDTNTLTANVLGDNVVVKSKLVLPEKDGSAAVDAELLYQACLGYQVALKHHPKTKQYWS